MSIITYNCTVGGLPEKLIAHQLAAQIKMKMSVPQMPNVHWMVNKIKTVVKCPTDHCGVMWRAVVMYYDGTRQRSADAYVGMMSRSIWKVWACLESIHRLGTDREGNWRASAKPRFTWKKSQLFIMVFVSVIFLLVQVFHCQILVIYQRNLSTSTNSTNLPTVGKTLNFTTMSTDHHQYVQPLQ